MTQRATRVRALAEMARCQRRVFEALRRAPGRELTGPELDQVAQRYGARLLELGRDFGVRWSKRHLKGSVWTYKLESWPTESASLSEPETDPPAPAVSVGVDPSGLPVSGSETRLALFGGPPATRSAITGRLVEQQTP